MVGTNGCGSKLNRKGKPQVLVHVSTYQSSILGTGFLSHSQIAQHVELESLSFLDKFLKYGEAQDGLVSVRPPKSNI